MAYTPKTWKDYGDPDATLVTASDLNHIEQGIKTAQDTADGKVDKVTGKGLSTNDYTTTEKSKLNGIAEGAEVNVQSDWNVTDTSSDSYIQNKPSIPSQLADLTSDATHRVVSDTEKDTWGHKYSKPTGGIPSEDLSSTVTDSISTANTNANAAQRMICNDIWSATTQYVAGDYVRYDNYIWKCLVDTIGGELNDLNSDWEQVTITEELCDVNNSLLNILTWTLANTGGSAKGVGFPMPTSAKEYLIVAIGSGNIYSIQLPNTGLVGYVAMGGLSTNGIRAYINGSGTGQGTTDGYTYYCYYR